MNASFDKIDSESAYREFLRMESRIEEMEVRVKYGTSAEANTEYSRSQYSDEVEAEIEKMRSLSLEKTEHQKRLMNNVHKGRSALLRLFPIRTYQFSGFSFIIK